MLPNHPRQPRLASKTPTAGLRRQTGVVLIISLIMLVIIALTSAAIMRNSLSADIVSQNTRRQAQATQAAQTALRYCENLAVNGTPRSTYVKDAATPESWNVFTNWAAPAAVPTSPQTPDVSSGLVSVDSSVLAPVAATTNDKFRFAPQCMAQWRTVGTGAGAKQVIVVTARGFSSDYQESATRRTEAGSVVWLQSILRLAE